MDSVIADSNSHRYRLRSELLRLLPQRFSDDPLKAARQLAECSVWRLPGGRAVCLSDDWSATASLPRSEQRLLHVHAFVADLVAAARSSGEDAFLGTAIRLIAHWRRQFAGNPRPQSAAYHDESVAQRLMYWLRLYAALEDGKQAHQSSATDLAEWLRQEAEILSDDAFYAGLNNHGMFQDRSLIYYCAAFPESDLWIDVLPKALRRFANYFQTSVASDGVHKEHSPAYHVLIARNIARNLGLLRLLDDALAQELRRLLDTMRRYAVNIVTPEMTLPPIGDTSPVALPGDYFNVFCASGPSRQPEPSAVFEEGGYAILRDDPALGRAQTYVVLTASDHGHYHKHQDDLGVLIYSDGWLVTEAGPFGYDYDHPLSAYAYSAAAHSTVLVGGTNPGRGVPFVPGRVRLVAHGDTGGTAFAEAISLKREGLEHVRRVTLNRTSRQVEVCDAITSQVPAGLCAVWHLAPGVDANVDGQAVSLTVGGNALSRLWFDSSQPVTIALTQGAQCDPVRGLFFPVMGQTQDATVVVVSTSEYCACWKLRTLLQPPHP